VLTKVPHAGDGFFAGIDPHVVSWVPEYRKPKGPAEPQRFELPQRYYDWSFMLAHFPASARAISRLLPEDAGLEPVTIAPGIGIVSLAAFEYRKLVSLEAYNEMGVMFPVRLRPTLSLPSVPLFRPEWFADLGFYIWQLPVNKDDAREAGVRLWGFPKSLAEITFADVYEDIANRLTVLRANGRRAARKLGRGDCIQRHRAAGQLGRTRHRRRDQVRVLRS